MESQETDIEEITDDQEISSRNFVDDVIKTGTVKLSSRFEREDWLSVEKRLSAHEQEVVRNLVELGKKIKSELDGDLGTIRDDFYVLGEQLYLEYRELLKKPYSLVDGTLTTKKDDTEDAKKKKKQKTGSKEKIRLENSKRRAFDAINKSIESFNGKIFVPFDALKSDIIEIKGIGMMYCGWFVIENKSRYNKKKQLPFVLEIMVTIQRFLNRCQNITGISMMDHKVKINISKTLLNDLEKWLTKLSDMYPYNGFVIYDYAPSLLIYTDYDKYIPSIGIRPRQHQIDLIKNIDENFENGFLFSYNPMIGAGKTTSIVSIATKIEILKKTPKYKHLQILFACNLPSVKIQIANLCYNANIKFGIASNQVSKNGGSKTYKITNHTNCKKDDERCVIVTSPEICYEILSDLEKTEEFGTPDSRFLLFLDEPTIGADIKDSDPLKKNMSVLTVMPKRTILSSATFPDLNSIQTIINTFKDKYPESKIDTIYSNEIQIGCDVKTYDNEHVVPHLGIKSSEELKMIISVIQKCPFLGRNYTPNIVRSLWKNMKQYQIQNLPNIAVLFKNVDNMTSDEVRKIAMTMLDILTTQPNEIIEKICQSSILEDKENIFLEEELEKKENLEFEWEKETEDDPTLPMDFTKLGTTQAWRYPNTTLIATPNPVEFAKTNFRSLLDAISDSEIENNGPKYKNSRNIIQIYHKESAEFEKQKANIKRNNKNEDRQTQELQDFDEMNKPKLKFPSFGQINTLDHIHKYSSNHAKEGRILGCFVRPKIILDEIPFDKFSITDEIMTLLFSGVGVYTHKHYELDQSYLKYVLNLASDGSLAYLIADSSICYGTNYPINRVIITDEFASNHSINTLFQLMGRAGRVGKSWVAEAFVSNEIAKRLISYTRNLNESFIEANNMVLTFNDKIKERIDELQHKLDKQMKKINIKDNIQLNDQLKYNSDEKVNEKTKEIIVKSIMMTVIENVEINEDTEKVSVKVEQKKEIIDYEKHKDSKSLYTHYEETNRTQSTFDLDDRNKFNSMVSWRKPIESSIKTEPKTSKYIPPHMRQSVEKVVNIERIERLNDSEKTYNKRIHEKKEISDSENKKINDWRRK